MGRGTRNTRKNSGKSFQTSSKERLGYKFTPYTTREGRRHKIERLHQLEHKKYLDERAALKGLSAERCEECEERIPSGVLGEYTQELYDRPSDKNCWVAQFCSDDCCEKFHDSTYEFSYWLCDDCERYICQRSPSNGYIGHFHFGEELICNACYEQSILENGQPREDFEQSRFGGGSEFYVQDILDNGYEPVEKWNGVRCSSGKDAEAFNADALSLIDSGASILTRIVPLGKKTCFRPEKSVN
jgi:hypothetical protein